MSNLFQASTIGPHLEVEHLYEMPQIKRFPEN